MFIWSFKITIVIKYLIMINLLILQVNVVEGVDIENTIVSIRTRLPEQYYGDNHYCAGTIIDSKFILTTAHCVSDEDQAARKPRDLLVVIGAINRLRPTKDTKQLVVDKIYIKEEFSTKNIYNIAVLRMRQSVTGSLTQAVPLTNSAPTPGLNCKIAGWGRIYEHGPLASRLVKADVTLSSTEECEKMSFKYGTDYGVICATRALPKPCNGDAGGPLICNDHLTGIISWVIGCQEHGYPSLFTDIHYHRKWIDNIIKNGTFKLIVHHYLSIMFILLIYFIR